MRAKEMNESLQDYIASINMHYAKQLGLKVVLNMQLSVIQVFIPSSCDCILETGIDKDPSASIVYGFLKGWESARIRYKKRVAEATNTIFAELF